jgi:hypothetical protein
MRTEPAPRTQEAGADVKHARARADSFFVGLAEVDADPTRSA